MKTLDRYIIRQFLINFVILLVVFTLLFVMVDLIVDMDEFVKVAGERSEAFGGFLGALLWTLGDYYGPELVLLYVFFSGLMVLAAMGFAVGGLARKGELTAMVSSGISMHRLAAPVVVMACLLNVVTLLSQEFVIPGLAHKLTRSKSQLRYGSTKTFQIRYAVDSSGHLLSAAQFNAQLEPPMLTGVTILERDGQGRAIRRVTAEQAFWDESRQGWELVGGFAIQPMSQGDGRATAIEAREVKTENFFPSDLSPQVLLTQRARIYPRFLSFAKLRELAANPAVNDGPIRQIMHSRFSLLVLNVLVLVIGLPFFLRREPANMLRQGVLAVSVCLVAWGMGMVLPDLAAATLNPVAAAWLPVVILLPVSAVGLQWVRT